MAVNLREQTAKILEAADTLNATAAAIVSASGQQEEAMKGFEVNVAQVGASSHEISSTSQELARTMNDLRNVSEEASQLARDGQESLSGLQDAMQTLTRGTDVIADKLTLILTKAGNIDGIVETITRIADQTNLLSLNAAIEAEKAGDYGRGFSVVAREIGRLANETAVSTLDIMEIIGEMQSSVVDGVKEMEHFREGVTRGIQSADNATGQLSQVIERVAWLSPELDKVNEGMHFQSIGSRQISDAMADLNNSASRMTGSLSQFRAVTDQLNRAAVRLRDAVSRFRI
jgi:methyl-accepting chemotaxis protein WspA